MTDSSPSRNGQEHVANLRDAAIELRNRDNFGYAQEVDEAADAMERLVREREGRQYECDANEARFENARRHLTRIHGLLNPPIITAGEGKSYKFINPHANEVLQALSDAIRGIPADLLVASEREPMGFAVVMDDGAGLFVGCYRTREMAQSVRDKQPPSHNDVVVPIYE